MMGYIIELHDGLPLTYWSDSTYVHPSGSWGEKKDAKIFAQDKDAQAYINTRLQTQAELCKVIPL